MADTLALRDPQRPFWWTALCFIVGIEALGMVVGGLFAPTPGGWYFQLEKPALNPPAWVFPVAWTLLYAMMGWAIARIWARPAETPGRATALWAFGVQLALNLSWSIVFFGLQALSAAVVATLALLASVLVATAAMARVDRMAGALMLPYCAWVAFAFYLTIWIAGNN
ncbi:MAG: TspO/MBR family protein [Pseudomonadota bacterium]